MAWPPVIPPATRANSTAQLDAHPSDHNAISTALTDIVARINALQPNWTTLPFDPGWAAYGSGYFGGHYRKVGDIVYLRGVIKQLAPAAPSGQVMAILPAGYRPSSTAAWVTMCGGGTAQVEVRNTGNVVFAGGVTGAPTSSFVGIDVV